jgi:hypothetical protein
MKKLALDPPGASNTLPKAEGVKAEVTPACEKPKRITDPKMEAAKFRTIGMLVQKITGSKVHKQLLAVLQDYPEGLTCHQMLKRFKGIDRMLKAETSKRKFDTLPPVTFFDNLPGILSNKTGKTRLYFLDPQFSSQVGDRPAKKRPAASGSHKTRANKKLKKMNAIKNLAGKLEGTDLHKQILGVLQDHLGGLTRNKFHNHIKPLKLRIQDASPEGGIKFYMTVFDLLPGILCKTGSKRLFFLDPDYKVPDETKDLVFDDGEKRRAREIPEEEIAVAKDLLLLLKRELDCLDETAWPTKVGELEIFLADNYTQASATTGHVGGKSSRGESRDVFD